MRLKASMRQCYRNMMGATLNKWIAGSPGSPELSSGLGILAHLKYLDRPRTETGVKYVSFDGLSRIKPLLHTQEVTGSSPVTPTNLPIESSSYTCTNCEKQIKNRLDVHSSLGFGQESDRNLEKPAPVRLITWYRYTPETLVPYGVTLVPVQESPMSEDAEHIETERDLHAALERSPNREVDCEVLIKALRRCFKQRDDLYAENTVLHRKLHEAGLDTSGVADGE